MTSSDRTRSYFVRHSEAGRRHAWTQPDELRPLTEEGWRQARGLVELLADGVFTRMLSSPFVRCIQTLEPLAQARGLGIRTTPLLAEGAGGAGAVGLAADVADGPPILCSHGDVMEEALDVLGAEGVPLEGRPDETPKGATWIFEVGEGRIVRGTLLPPPECRLVFAPR